MKLEIVLTQVSKDGIIQYPRAQVDGEWHCHIHNHQEGYYLHCFHQLDQVYPWNFRGGSKREREIESTSKQYYIIVNVM